MRTKRIGVLVVAWAIVGIVWLAQGLQTDGPFTGVTDEDAKFTLAVTDDEGRFFAGTTDDEAKFSCTVNFASITKITGSLSEALGDLAALPVKLLFESRPEILQILGIGNVGAL